MMDCTKYGSGSGICPVTFGLALGVTCGLLMMICAWTAWLWGYGATVVAEHAMVYPGYEATFAGGLVGGLWGLLKGFIFGFVLIMIYNILCCCRNAACSSNDDVRKGRK